ncbi:hypothetical protein [Pseudomonas putida]|uniref:hypothetical protein n=1 Tax=Pseudomonas putida TaxID=303 RepID=UPI000FA12B84|nr:hypothetical protein [Pseudomonas putida]MCG3644549.1 hypothetical protein [Pseudomonas putida]TFW21404.1 hypothetical protein E4L40_19250 [Pseudomonas putida]
MAKKTSLNYQDRERLAFLTSHLRSGARPSVKARYEQEIVQLLEGKELTRGDIALAAYYFKNSGVDAESQAAGQEYADLYRAMPNE